MNKKVIAVVLGVMAIFTGIHFIIANSDGCKIAELYLRQNSEVLKVVGDISRMTLLPLATQVHDHGNDGNATYHIRVKGAQASVTGIVSSIKSDGRWTVRKAHLVKDDDGVIILKE
jgi:hypothetical protein